MSIRYIVYTLKPMPQTKTKPAAPKAGRKPKPVTEHQWKSKGLAQRIGDGLKQDLATELDAFVTNAYPEEARFVLSVLRERDNESPNIKSRDSHDVPLLTAIEQLISGYDRYVLLVPEREMVTPVEELINSLEQATEKNAPPRAPYTSTELRERRNKELKRLVDVFLKDASADDLFFMVSVLNRWDGYLDYDEKDRPSSPILAVFQMESDSDMSSLIRMARTGQAEQGQQRDPSKD